MNYSIITVVLLSLCISPAILLRMKQPKCRGVELHLSEEELQGMTDCMKEFAPEVKMENGTDPTKASKAIPKEKMACLGKCILAKEGLIDKEGMPSKDNMIQKINATMPAEVMEDLDSAMGKCVDEHGEKVDPKDKTCQTYQPLTNCMTVALVEVCKMKE